MTGSPRSNLDPVRAAPGVAGDPLAGLACAIGGPSGGERPEVIAALVAAEVIARVTGPIPRPIGREGSPETPSPRLTVRRGDAGPLAAAVTGPEATGPPMDRAPEGIEAILTPRGAGSGGTGAAVMTGAPFRRAGRGHSP